MPSLITSISPTPVQRGTTETFTAVVKPWDIQIESYVPIFLYVGGEAPTGDIGFLGEYLESEQLQRAIVQATVPMTAQIGAWKLIFVTVWPQPGGEIGIPVLTLKIDSKPKVTFDISA